MSNAGQSLLWFLFIIALIPLALWMLKRSSLGGLGSMGAGNVTRVVSTTSLGPQQRLVTVEVGSGDARQWLVLGVTPHSITAVHTLAPQEPVATPDARAPISFASLLNKARKD